jgi:hypothetical protein
VRKIDLSLDLVWLEATGACGFVGHGGFAGRAEVRPYLVRFMVFKGTGVGLLLGDANHWKRVEDCPALDFQLSSQIVDSNLAHPPFLTSGLSR